MINQNLKENATHGTSEYPFTVYHMQKYHDPFSVPLHWHNEIEIVYVQEGELYLTIDNTSYIGKAGDIFFINGGEIHDMNVKDLDTIYGTILFPISSLIFMNMDIVNKEFLMPLSEQKMKLVNTLSSPENHKEIWDSITKIVKLYYEKKAAYQLGIRMELLSLLYQLYLCNGIIQATRELTYNNLHREILSYINDNYCAEITLEQISAHFHMSPKYFSRYFHSTFHITMTDYINHLRLDKALVLLENSELSITEIALQCGYSSCSYFNKKFKASYHKSPSAYRK